VKFYLASSFDLVDKVEKVSKSIEGYGHSITVKWWSRVYDIPNEGKVKTTILKKRYEKLDPDEFYNRPETRRSYLDDFKGVVNADVFIFVADEIPRKYNGANVELGIALANNIMCFSIGNLETSPLYYDVLKRNSIEDILKELFNGG